MSACAPYALPRVSEKCETLLELDTRWAKNAWKFYREKFWMIYYRMSTFMHREKTLIESINI